ncbi:MAG: c-type cytochrome domain-containing protein, partial [Planctomycetota bacterium]|nr:c-type cytochrome domain-containing protein [Planctomycetota bacterium]
MNSLCRISFFCFYLLAVLAGLSQLHAQEPTAEQLSFFEQKIRPVLAEHCYKCHSARSKKLKAELYLDSREGLLKGGETGPIVVPGKPEASLLIRAVVYLDNELEMPPNKKLPDKVIADLQEWIRIGAPWPEEKPTQNAAQARKSQDWNKLRLESWAFRPVNKPT